MGLRLVTEYTEDFVPQNRSEIQRKLLIFTLSSQPLRLKILLHLSLKNRGCNKNLIL